MLGVSFTFSHRNMPKRKPEPTSAVQARKSRRKSTDEVVIQERQAKTDAELNPTPPPPLALEGDVGSQIPGSSIPRSDPVIPTDLAKLITDTVTKAIDQVIYG